ncbi:LacI family DNA-binding transcriptional regulator [Paenibacillus agricola]|uniref:LacI family transcriptional regulator n=1 Tax=Paenibacillus agricola TaxID=2716264 RepID=A0ABX0J4S4_9BACL|nr:LacI family DNA-binding transcriptional regulator [Paenibacillus agricola]NHN29034.1 LacI family transcriptional regulator [Paenibacillus agricola]
MVSSKDVARAAGVSQATVSRVLNNPESVRPVKRNKVLEAIQQLNYEPNLIARSLVTNNTRTIAFISGSMRNNFFIDTMDSIINLAKDRGYRTMIFFDGNESLKDIWSTVKGHMVDGVILSLVSMDDPVLEDIMNSGIPHMFLSRRPRFGGNYIEIDNRLAGELIASHVVELGHRRIALLSGELQYSTFLGRKEGIDKVMAEAGLPLEAGLVHYINTATLSEIEKVVWKMMQFNEPPTAIICTSDAMAIACMDVLLGMGLSIPGDVSISGIDDSKLAAHQSFQLTTVGHKIFEIGEIAVENLLEMIGHKEIDKKRQIVLRPELMIRRTTARHVE